jgi:mRNA-degrading endonuclease YafQ of YafQ-DinJ toxin-antitoxin module
MRIALHKNFEKQYAKLRFTEKEKFKEKRNLFLNDPFNPILNNHSVDKIYPGWRSINITGNYRALYEPKTKDLVVFMKIGTHSELY